jgi:hypothetical protein
MFNSFFIHAREHEDAPHLLPPHFNENVPVFLKDAPVLCKRLLNRETYFTRESYKAVLIDVGRFLKDKRFDNFQFNKTYLLSPIIDFDNHNSYYFINIYLKSHINSVGTKLNLCPSCHKSQYLFERNVAEFNTENLRIPVVFDAFRFIIFYEFLDTMYRSIKTKFIINYDNDEGHKSLIADEPGLHPYMQAGGATAINHCDKSLKVNILPLPDDDNFFYTVAYVKALLEPDTDSTISRIEEMKHKKEEYKAMEYGRILENTYCWVFF